MKRIKYLIPILIMFIVVNVKAIDACTPEEMNRLRELANNVQFKTEYELTDEEDDDNDEKTYIYYAARVINMNNDLKVLMKKSTDIEFQPVIVNDYIYSQSNDIEYFVSGEKVTFKIYSHTTNLCTNELLKTVDVEFDYYNTWYYDNKENCKKYPDFKYCKEFMKTDKSDEEIDKLFNEYKKDTKGESDSKILDFISNNKYVIIIVFAVIIIGLAVVIILKRNKKEKI